VNVVALFFQNLWLTCIAFSMSFASLAHISNKVVLVTLQRLGWCDQPDSMMEGSGQRPSPRPPSFPSSFIRRLWLIHTRLANLYQQSSVDDVEYICKVDKYMAEAFKGMIKPT
jgi:hypothetical protein